MADQKKEQIFEQLRPHLRSVAYRMLGSLAEADDAVQEAWIRYGRTDTTGVNNVGGWLTTVTARICLNQLNSRKRRGEVELDGYVPDPLVHLNAGGDPEGEAMLADSVGMAMMIVLDTLSPAERVAFVLHDLFNIPFEDIAELTDRTNDAVRQLASRARKRVRDAAPKPDRDVARQQEVVGAFFDAARRGDFDALVATLDPEVVSRSDRGPTERLLVLGAGAVASGAITYADPAAEVRPAIVNGGAGVLILRDDVVVTVMAFTVVDGHVVRIDALGDPARLARLALG